MGGSYRAVRVSPDDPNEITKVAFSSRPRRKGAFPLPVRVRAWLKGFGSDVNAADLRNYQRHFKKIPPHLRENFVRLHRVEGRGRTSVLYAEAVRDYDGTLSQPLEKTGRISNRSFWARYDEMVEWVVHQKIHLFDLTDKNILVKWKSPTECTPVLIDYKIMGARHFPLQPWLWIPFFAGNKVRRRAARNVMKYRVSKG